MLFPVLDYLEWVNPWYLLSLLPVEEESCAVRQQHAW